VEGHDRLGECRQYQDLWRTKQTHRQKENGTFYLSINDTSVNSSYFKQPYGDRFGFTAADDQVIR